MRPFTRWRSTCSIDSVSFPPCACPSSAWTAPWEGRLTGRCRAAKGFRWPRERDPNAVVMQGGGGCVGQRAEESGEKKERTLFSPRRRAIGPATFSLVSISTRGRECEPYLRSFRHLGVSSSSARLPSSLSAHARTSRTSWEANCSSLRRLRRCGNDVLGGVKPNRSLQRRDTWGGRSATTSRPRLPDSWTSAQRECETEFECHRSLSGGRVGRGQARRLCGSGETNHSRGRVALVDV